MKSSDIAAVLLVLFLFIVLVAASSSRAPAPAQVPLNVTEPPQNSTVPPPEIPFEPPQNDTEPPSDPVIPPPVENETLVFFVASTELIEFEGMTSTEVNTFIGLLVSQGIPEITLRLHAMYDWSGSAPTAAEVAKVKTIINAATSAGVTVSLDMHTWYTTWDSYFRDSASGYVANRVKYLAYVTACINAYAGYPVKAWMVMNEPQDRHASASENNFILSAVTTAQGLTDKPVSVRFMGSGSPTTGDYSAAIDTATDFLCRNMYWTSGSYYDPRNYSATPETEMIEVVTVAHAAGKEAWITEFGKTKSNQEAQRSYVRAALDWGETKGFDRMFCWASQPDVSGENYNIFSGYTPLPAFYELVSSDEGGPETYVKQFTFSSSLLETNQKTFTMGSSLQATYYADFTFGSDLIDTPTEPIPKEFTFGTSLQANYSVPFTFGSDLIPGSTVTFTFGSELELGSYVTPVMPAAMQGSLSFLNAIAQLERYNGIKQVFEPGVCVPGLDNFECPLRTIIKKMET